MSYIYLIHEAVQAVVKICKQFKNFGINETTSMHIETMKSHAVVLFKAQLFLNTLPEKYITSEAVVMIYQK